METPHLSPVTDNVGAGNDSSIRWYCIMKEERGNIGSSIWAELRLLSSRFIFLQDDSALKEYIILKYGNKMSSCKDSIKLFKRITNTSEICIAATCFEPDGTKRIVNLTHLLRC